MNGRRLSFIILLCEILLDSQRGSSNSWDVETVDHVDKPEPATEGKGVAVKPWRLDKTDPVTRQNEPRADARDVPLFCLSEQTAQSFVFGCLLLFVRDVASRSRFKRVNKQNEWSIDRHGSEQKRLLPTVFCFVSL